MECKLRKACKVLVLTNNSNSMQLISFLERNGENVSVINDRLELDMIKHISPQIIISYNYKYLISREVINYVKGEIFNLHISYLPWNKGANPNYWSFMDDTPKGVTIHQVSEGLDAGDILDQVEMVFDENEESFSSSYQKLNDRIVELFVQNWDSIKNKTYHLKKQEGLGTYHTIKDFKEFTGDGIVNWDVNVASYKRDWKIAHKETK